MLSCRYWVHGILCDGMLIACDACDAPEPDEILEHCNSVIVPSEIISPDLLVLFLTVLVLKFRLQRHFCRQASQLVQIGSQGSHCSLFDQIWRSTLARTNCVDRIFGFR